MVKKVKCPTCSKPVIWSPDNAWRPFCSERCRQIAFSNPTYGVGDGFLQRTDNPRVLRSYEDVAADPAARVGVVVGAVQNDYAARAGVDPSQVVVFPDPFGPRTATNSPGSTSRSSSSHSTRWPNRTCAPRSAIAGAPAGRSGAREFVRDAIVIGGS